ncbi:prepilin-type N-terminal cleavage/methylation domain-containing protein [Pseudomarimonas arenosa]|uniref:Prepilin-type N-terminal cleavage/methylation domain-containing protein n=1 Tax=Pseudomarimonas arenosa TaxID=2774145 RepID=A0AAW3ZNF0_9GAMM|nr:prepilin-type N-terminal cleavage/methylation domain-containing protein [Pseudomarimonas arenosa]MBD8526450.1 prepilin-type N-terminal cleavage/methylation domain-containing protein [Pseudomarimonas arenosa]
MTAPTRPTPAQSGFTLLEILLSVALLSLIITLAYGSLRVAARASASGERLIERSEELRATQGFMRRQFMQVMITPFERPGDGDALNEKRFEGSADAARFVAPMPGYLSRGGAHVQELALVRDANGYSLQFRFSQLNGFDAEQGIPADVEPVVLMDGLADARFEFRGVIEGELSDWSSDWEEPWQLPAFVRLLVEFPQGDARKWPAFEVPIPAGAQNATLSFDNIRRAGAPNDPRARQAP